MRKMPLIGLGLVLMLLFIIVAVYRSGASSTPAAPLPALPTKGAPGGTAMLVFATEPVNATAGSVFPAELMVKIEDAGGNTVTDSTAPVTLAVQSGPGFLGGGLSGTTTVDAVKGVATFTDLSIDLAEVNYMLAAISPGLTSALSNSFNVVPGPAVALVFTAEPDIANAGKAFDTQPVVNIVDSCGNTVTTAKATVTLAITPGTGTSGAQLSGVTTLNAQKGVVTFAYLSINPAGYGYKLTAISPGLTPAVGDPFNIY